MSEVDNVIHIIRKVGPFTLSATYSESKDRTVYTINGKTSTLQEHAKSLGPPKEFKKLTEEELTAMQPASTKAKMLGTYDKEYPYAKDLETNEMWVADKEAYDEMKRAKEAGDTAAYQAALNKLTKTRIISPEEMAVYAQWRESSKNTENQSELEGSTKERKEKAANALQFSPGVPVLPQDAHKITNMTPIKSEAPTEKEEKVKKHGIWNRFKYWIDTGLRGDDPEGRYGN